MTRGGLSPHPRKEKHLEQPHDKQSETGEEMKMPRDLNENEIEWQFTEAQKGKDRVVRSVSMRRSRARLDSMLTPTMRDASREIDKAYEDRAKGLGYALLGASGAQGGGGLSLTEEMIEEICRRIARLSHWERQCSRLLRNAVYALNQTEHTATTYAKLTNQTTMEVTLWYREGLRVYCKLRGWE